jgi:CarD family transcriptional regulator
MATKTKTQINVKTATVAKAAVKAAPAKKPVAAAIAKGSVAKIAKSKPVVAAPKLATKPVAAAKKTPAVKTVAPVKAAAPAVGKKPVAQATVAGQKPTVATVKKASASAAAPSSTPASIKSAAARVQAFRAAQTPAPAPVAAKPIQKPAAAPQQRAMQAAALSKNGSSKISAVISTAPVAAPAAAGPKKSISSRHGFKTNEFVVYPSHGVGKIIGIEDQEIAGMTLELFVINFEKEKLTLRVPTGKLEAVGMRKLADEVIVRRAMEVLKGRARVKRTMWSRRAQEYVAKINSGDLISIAEVVRDLYRSEAQPEQSYSERQLYEEALDRMSREIAAVDKLDDRGAVQRITDVLSRCAKTRRAAETAEDAVVVEPELDGDAVADDVKVA